MGLSSSKSTSGPSKQALPWLNSASSAVQSAYNSNQSNLADISSSLSDAFKSYSSSLGSGLTGANSYINDVLSGTYLNNGNPELQNVIDSTNASVTDQINALFSKAGQSTSGSTRATGELAKQLATNESNLRYQNYSDEQARMMEAVNAALGLNSANNENYETLASLGSTAATTPYLGASFLADALGGLWGKSTTTSTGSNLLNSLVSLGSSLGSAAITASDPELKTNVELIGRRDDGLNVYAFDYIAPPNDEIGAYMEGGRRIGVMADEVAILRPDALGPVVGGYRTVNYGAL